MGFHGCLHRAKSHFGLTESALSLDLPEGALDLMILWWRDDDRIFAEKCPISDLKSLKIRDKIATAVKMRLNLIFDGTNSADGLLGQCLWPSRLATLMGLIWETSDQIWRLCGDISLDENHYSKRAIVQMMIFDLWQTRSNQGVETMEARLLQQIDGVMRFETFKRTVPFSPTAYLNQAMINMAKIKTHCRFG